jgi:predicted DNA-binding protein with PD1-like motif
MKSKAVVEGQERTFILILDAAEEAFRTISAFADRENITGASVTAIGAFEHAKVGWFDVETKRYKPISVAEQCEVLSLVGDIAQGDDSKASLHLHAVLGLSDGSVRGGHLIEGIVRPTLEVTIVEPAAHLRRKRHPELGLHLSKYKGSRQVARHGNAHPGRGFGRFDRPGSEGRSLANDTISMREYFELASAGDRNEGDPAGVCCSNRERGRRRYRDQY